MKNIPIFFIKLLIAIISINSLTFLSLNASTIPEVQNGTYYIRNMKSGLYLDVSGGGTVNGTNVQLWDANTSNAHKWDIIPLDNGLYVIRTLVDTNKALDVRSHYTSSGSNIDIWTAGSINTTQSIPQYQWHIDRNDDGTICLSSAASNHTRFLDAYNGNTSSGTNVRQWEYNGNPSMRWILESTNVSSNIQNWDLVDSNIHIDWDGNTKYLNHFNNAVNTWNHYLGNTLIRRDVFSTIKDLTISDFSDIDHEVYAFTTDNGTIRFNTVYIDSLFSIDQNAFVREALVEDIVLHELGHALGLGHTQNYGDVMNELFFVSYINPSRNDISSLSTARTKY